MSTEPLRDALERLAPADPWVGVEITTESYQPADVCRECLRDKPRRKADRGFESHEPDCAWVQARRALAQAPQPVAGRLAEVSVALGRIRAIAGHYKDESKSEVRSSLRAIYETADAAYEGRDHEFYRVVPAPQRGPRTEAEASLAAPAGLREDVLGWVFALYEGAWTDRVQVRILGNRTQAAEIIARKYAEFAARYPLEATPRSPEPYVTCGMDGCDFAVERGEGHTMALHQSEDHP